MEIPLAAQSTELAFLLRKTHTVKENFADSRPQPGCHLPNSLWPGIIFPVPVPGRFGKKKNHESDKTFFYSA